MRVSIVKAKPGADLEEMINDKIMDLIDDEKERKIFDVKCWSDGDDPSWQYAVITWGLKGD